MSFGKRTRHGICFLEKTILITFSFFRIKKLCLVHLFSFSFQIEATFEIYEFVLLARPDTIFSVKAASILVSDMVLMHLFAFFLKNSSWRHMIFIFELFLKHFNRTLTKKK